MSDCISSSMTGSTDAGPLQPREDPAPLPVQLSTFERPVSEDSSSSRRNRRQTRRKMTSAPPPGQVIQLTPLWEHVVRTRRFPSEVDAQATFIEISERLRDPEWEVRQHALRVLMDVLPTLKADVVDKVMQPVVSELINNLGHPAPAVRKGALDTLRVYLIHSSNRDNMVKTILHDGLNRPDAHNPFQTNVTTGVILSAPLLLFPSSNSPPPTSQILKDATIAFASRLVQIPHQEAVLKSLMKIRDAVGEEEFDSYLADYDDKMKKNIEILSEIYNIKPNKKKQKRNNTDIMKTEKSWSFDKSWDSDSDTSGIAEEEDEILDSNVLPARVVLETEIKFNEETAITMTILEEKDDHSNDENDIENDTNVENDENNLECPSSNKRKTPRRVHFGGEIVKLRTPDSDETESIEITPTTRIPLPVSPATKMPERIKRRPSSQPCSPHTEKRKARRTSRSATNSPKRETYTHNAQLSPKKSILTRTGCPLIIINSATEEVKNPKNVMKERKSGEPEEKDCSEVDNLHEINETARTEQIIVAQSTLSSLDNEEKLMMNNERNGIKDEKIVSESIRVAVIENSKNVSLKGKQVTSEKDNHAEVIKLDKNNTSEGVSRQIKDHKLLEQSSPIKKTLKEIKKDVSDSRSSNPQLEKKSLKDEKVSENFFCESKINADTNYFPFGSPVKECNTRLDRLIDSDFVDDIQGSCGLILEDRIATNVNYNDGETSVKDNDSERKWRNQCDRKGASEGNGSLTCSSSEGEGKPQEPSWEELGLVGQEVLDDLHNKDDWRARVRALERVASALRTSSALIAIESRLGSLLHAVLGGERSCRVAAAGLAVAKVVIAGVSEDALKKKLPQLASGLARQGGPAATQLARIAMLRLRPSLLLDQLLQPHCLSARNAKTRENALQLLIFSLVTFPSTEFKVETVASRVATMVTDRRRRVRQAALDALAVLAQIYDAEEILKAGQKAAEECNDAEAILAAIRARLARKSLPLVSADGLVVYGLQISPTVQIATGPDVDWIVAGSGSVSPGTGRTRGQIIATSRSAQGRASRNENINNRESPWIERPNLIALGVGLQSKTEQSAAWQILSSQNHDDNENEIKELNGRNLNIRSSSSVNLRFEEHQRSSYTSSNHLSNFIGANVKNHKEIIDNNFGSKIRNPKDIDEVTKEKESVIIRTESKIPILSIRERSKVTPQNRKRSVNSECVNCNLKKSTKDVLDNNRNRLNSRQESVGSYAATYQPRTHLQDNASHVILGSGQVATQAFDLFYSGYRPSITREYSSTSKSRETIWSDDNFHQCDRYNKFTNRNKSSNSIARRQQSLPRNIQQQAFIACETYNSIHDRERLADRNVYRPLQTAPNLSTHTQQEFPNLDQRIASSSKNIIFRSKDRRTKDTMAQQQDEVDLFSIDSQENEPFFPENFNNPQRRRLRSLSPTQLYRTKQYVNLACNRFHTTSMYEIDKVTVNEQEHNARNKRHFSPETNSYHMQNCNEENNHYQVSERVCEPPKTASSSSSDDSTDNRQNEENQNIALPDYNNGNIGSSPISQNQNTNVAFDIITQQTNRSNHDDVDSFFMPTDSKNIDCQKEMANTLEDEVLREWSSEDEMKLMNRIQTITRRSEHKELITMDENCNRSTESSSDILEQPEDRSIARKRSIILNERILPHEDTKVEQETSQSTCAPDITSPKILESYKLSHNSIYHSPISNSPSKRNSRCNSRNVLLEYQTEELRNSSEEKIVASVVPDEDVSVQSLDIIQSHIDINMSASTAIIIASRPHSHETIEYVENSKNENCHNRNNIQESTEEESSVNDTLEDRQSKDSTSETNTEPGILKIEPHPIELSNELRRRIPSKVPRSTSRYRMLLNKKVTEKPSEKSKPIIQQCFAQLENKDWEVTMKGLKALSQISKQNPEYLDICATGVIGRLLGRHIRNLRSQVARAACIAAGDIFSSQIRGIDQDLDDIAGPLLHRTADTNRFLRADSNAALDQMVQYLPPHKTIGIILHRGASHQNAIVRATTARLLSEITDRIGPEHIMILPRDVKDKLLNTGAKLLMDGNLDARNHSKKMFRRLTRCEGFRKALTIAVPETTLRHIDKTMKTL